MKDIFSEIYLEKRKPETNKKDYGTLFSFCGSKLMTGAAVLSSLGALYSGVGLINCAGEREVIKVLQNHLLEPVYTLLETDENCSYDVIKAENTLSSVTKNISAVLCGCGLGKSPETKEIIRIILKYTSCPALLDADALNMFAGDDLFFDENKNRLIITPHPGEMSRLCGKTLAQIQENRVKTAMEFSKKYDCITVLKGHRTVICDSKGNIYINNTGNPGMAKGGSGDLLAGVISGFLAQGIPPFKAAVTGVYIHGKAGDMASKALGEYSMLPTDIAKYIPKAIMEITRT